MRTDFDKRAQTNIQLYSQLLASGYPIQDVSKVQASYRLSTQLFAGQVRHDGRPFVCHLVGVGSVLAMLESSTSTVIAGLLHSAIRTIVNASRGSGGHLFQLPLECIHSRKLDGKSKHARR